MADVKAGIPLSTAGTELAWAVETSKGVMPTSARFIPDVLSMPDMNAESEKIDVTDLSCKKYKKFINGLIDLSGASSYGANLTMLLYEEWKKLMPAYETAKAAGLQTWFFIVTPGLPTVAFPGEPGVLGIPGKEVNQQNKVNLSITVSGEPKWIEDDITITYPQSSGD